MAVASKFFWIVLALVVIALGVAVYDQLIKRAAVPVQAVYDRKIVYDINNSASEEEMAADCRKRGGEFNSCGSPCAPDAEFCIQVCAAVCELK